VKLAISSSCVTNTTSAGTLPAFTAEEVLLGLKGSSSIVRPTEEVNRKQPRPKNWIVVCRGPDTALASLWCLRDPQEVRRTKANRRETLLCMLKCNFAERGKSGTCRNEDQAGVLMHRRVGVTACRRPSGLGFTTPTRRYADTPIRTTASAPRFLPLMFPTETSGEYTE
jgi:hypothetical protein